jgi:hypothetical protein
MAWRSSMKFERGVLCEKGAVKKKLVFSSTTIADGKRAFSVDKTASYMTAEREAVIGG